MLIIGHRGAAGLAPENTLEALKAGFEASADILEFDVRLTKDGVPILSHNPVIEHRIVNRSTLTELKRVANITTLEEALDAYFGKVLLNIQFKPMKDILIPYKIIAEFVKTDSDWEDVLISSFHTRHLFLLRHLNSRVPLALLHGINPFKFIAYHRFLKLSAVGWHRLHVNPLALEISKEAGIFTYVYTVDNPKAAVRLARQGIDGLVTNYPDRIVDALQIEA